ncbi:hypothetical protein OHA64_41440 [Streptomyces sp. NBC_00076]
MTSAAVFVLHLVQSSPSMLTEQTVYLSASGLAGTVRFVVLPNWPYRTCERIRVGGTCHPPECVCVGAPAGLPQDCGRLPWFAPFLRRALFLRRRFDDIEPPLF